MFNGCFNSGYEKHLAERRKVRDEFKLKMKNATTLDEFNQLKRDSMTALDNIDAAYNARKNVL